VIGLGTVLATAGRLLVRHWPVLAVLYLAGSAGRELVMTAAVRVSDVNGVLGFLVLILVPITTLTAFVLMLRAMRPSLSTAVQSTMDSRSQLLDHLGSILVPFLAVYASYGYLNKDINEYVYRVWQAETLSTADLFDNPGNIDVSARLPFQLSVTLVSVVAVAVVLRWLLARWEGARFRAGRGLLGAYVEVIWITLVAVVFVTVQEATSGWLAGRRLVHWASATWYDIADSLGPLAGPARATGAWLFGLTGAVDSVFVVPIAWLAVGAVVFGRRIGRPEQTTEELRQQVTERWSTGRRAALPRLIRWLGVETTVEARSRFGPLLDSLRLLFRAGLVPMLFFCLAFLLAQSAADWLWELERLVVGPHDLNEVWRPLDAPLTMLNEGVRTILLAALLAAAIDRVLRVARVSQGSAARTGAVPSTV